MSEQFQSITIVREEPASEPTPVIETSAAPVAETTPTQSSTTTTPEQTGSSSEPKASVAEPVSAPVDSPAPVDRNAILSEFLSELGVDSLDTLRTKVTTEPPKPYEFKSDTARLLEEWKQQGRPEKLFLETQLHNFDEMPELEIVRNKYALDYPELTPEDINNLLEDDFKLDEELYDESTIIRAKTRLKVAASQARPELKQWQAQVGLPEPDNKAAELQAQVQQWEQAVDAAIPGFKSFDFSVGDDKLSLPVENASEIRDFMVQPDKIFEAWQDPKQMASDLFLLKNRDKIFAAILDQGKSKELASVEQQLKNPSRDIETPPPASSSLEARLGSFLFRK